jgi:photosystem II stability/assembly factor-like uncharacterized protein
MSANAIVSDVHGTLFMGADMGAALWRSTDRGRTWTQKTVGLNPVCEVKALLVKGGETVFAALPGGGVFVSRDHGESWIQINNHLLNFNIYSLTEAADGAILAGSSSGEIFRSDDDGGVWVETEGDSIRGGALALVTDSAGAIYAGCGWRGVLFSADGGRTWTPSSSGLENSYIHCLAIHNEGYILAGTSAGEIYRSAGGGEPWVRIDRGAISDNVVAIATDRAGNIFAGTSGHGAIRSRDGGDSWENADIGLQGLGVGSFLCGDGFLLAGSSSRGVFRSTDGGASWSAAKSYFPADPERYDFLWTPNALSVDSSGTYYLLNRRSIVRSRNGGKTWVRACHEIPLPLNCLAIHPNSSLFAGTEIGVYISNDSGDSWSIADTSSIARTAVHALEVAKNGAIFGNTENGVLRSTDGGASWENVFSEAPVTSISTGSGGRVYIGTEYRGVLGSSDNGATWRRMTDSLDIYSVKADRVGNVFAAYGKGILCSSDGGAVWKTIQPGGNYYWYGMVAAPNGEAAAFFDDEGKLFISEDRFSSWKTVPVPFGNSSLFMSPDGYLFISDRLAPGLHRSKTAL